MDIAARSLKTKRTVITKLLENGLYPYTKRYLGTFSNHFSTIGLIGMNEVGLNAKWLRADLTSPKTQRFTRDVLNHMRERLSDYQEKYGDLYNLEATPAESTTYRFALHDKEQFPDIITANMDGKPYYTNSSHLLLPEPFSTRSSARSFLTGKRQRTLSARSLRTTSCLTTQCLLHTPYVRITAI